MPVDDPAGRAAPTAAEPPHVGVGYSDAADAAEAGRARRRPPPWPACAAHPRH